MQNVISEAIETPIHRHREIQMNVAFSSIERESKTYRFIIVAKNNLKKVQNKMLKFKMSKIQFYFVFFYSSILLKCTVYSDRGDRISTEIGRFLRFIFFK